MEFQRARSDEQRRKRRQDILATAAAMLAEMPVASISLNELSRRVGLAKSNVLRYFESREAILIDLMDTEFAGWIAALETGTADLAGSPHERGDALAATLSRTLEQRPVLCDLIAAQASVLERNISTEAALGHKRATGASAARIVAIIREVLPELDAEEAYQVVVVTLLMASAAWPHSQPSPALQAAYEADTEVAASQLGFAEVLTPTIELTIAGLLARKG